MEITSKVNEFPQNLNGETIKIGVVHLFNSELWANKQVFKR